MPVEIHLCLVSNENYTEITIADNGIGFNVDDTIRMEPELV